MPEIVETERPNPSIAAQAASAVVGGAIVIIGLRVAVEIKRRRIAKKIKVAE